MTSKFLTFKILSCITILYTIFLQSEKHLVVTKMPKATNQQKLLPLGYMV